MTNTTPRQPGLRGRIPGQIVNVPHINKYRSTLVKHIPTYPVDVSFGITEWQMLGNDQYGDCTFAGREHYKMSKAAAAGITETWETPIDLVDEYLMYNHGKDVGANISQLLLSWFEEGKILAFAKLDHTNKAQVDWYMQNFFGVYCGVSLTDDANQKFAYHMPWTTDEGQRPNPMEGHCIVKVKATNETDTYVTWGALQQATSSWTSACLDEVYVIITAEDAKNHKINVAKLRKDLTTLADVHGAIGDTPVAAKRSTCRRLTDWFKSL